MPMPRAPFALSRSSSLMPTAPAAPSWPTDRTSSLVRGLAPFTCVRASTSCPVFVVQKTNASVQIQGSARARSLVETVVEDGVLRIEQRAAAGRAAGAFVAVALPCIEEVANLGSGALTITRVAQREAVTLSCLGAGPLAFQGWAGAVSADASGSGSLTLIGSAPLLSLLALGSGRVDAARFIACCADVKAAGSGSVAVRVRGHAALSSEGSGSIDATLDRGVAAISIAGPGGITWRGDADVALVHRTGSGHFTRQG